MSKSAKKRETERESERERVPSNLTVVDADENCDGVTANGKMANASC